MAEKELAVCDECGSLFFKGSSQMMGLCPECAHTHVCLNRQANGLSCGSVILLEQLRTIDKSRLRERVGALDTSEMKQIDWALGVSIGLAEGYR